MDIVGSVHECIRVFGHDQLLIGWNHVDSAWRVIGTDIEFCVSALRDPVLLQIDFNAENIKILRSPFTNMWSHLSHTCSVDQCIYSTEKGCIGSNVLFQSVALHLDRKFSSLITFSRCIANIPTVTHSADTHEATFLVQHAVHLFCGHACSIHHEREDGRVEIA